MRGRLAWNSPCATEPLPPSPRAPVGIALVVIGTAIVGSEFAVCPPKAGYACKGAVAGDKDKNAIMGVSRSPRSCEAFR